MLLNIPSRLTISVAEFDDIEASRLEAKSPFVLHPLIVGVESLVDDLLPEHRVLQLGVGEEGFFPLSLREQLQVLVVRGRHYGHLVD